MAASRPPDVEALLASPEATRSTHGSGPWRCLAVVSSVSLAGLCVLGTLWARRRWPLLSEAEDLVGLEGVPDGCFQQGMFYVGPHKLKGSPRTVEETPQDCQMRCGRTVACTQFSWWPDGGCLLTDKSSQLKASPFKWSKTVVGPRSCEDLSAYEAVASSGDSFCDDISSYDGPSLGLHDCKGKCDREGTCMFFSMWATGGEHWCRLTASCSTLTSQPGHTVSVYKRKQMTLPGSPFEAMPPLAPSAAALQVYQGVNGSSCLAYPACREANLAGNCCPNDEKVTLTCCSGLPLAPFSQVAAHSLSKSPSSGF